MLEELDLAGVKTDSESRTLTGEVRGFLIDDLGYNVDWTLRVVSKPFNESVKGNIEEIIKDAAFLKVFMNG